MKIRASVIEIEEWMLVTFMGVTLNLEGEQHPSPETIQRKNPCAAVNVNK